MRSARATTARQCEGETRKPFPEVTMSVMEVEELAALLHETAEHHDPFEKAAPKHDWWDWYAAYMNARMNGSAPEQASIAAAEFMDRVRHVRSP
jgi:hypothetical protein